MKQIRLNAFAMNAVGHVSPGLWRHPRDRSTEYTRLGHWLDLARTLERGLFDGIFFADVLGAYDVLGGSPAAALRQAAQVPVGDPLLLVPAMATVTEHLGFGVTASLAYEPPFLLARRFSTLDHLTGGRIAWNIVTSYLDSAARAAGRPAQHGHDERYVLAEDSLRLMLRLWEESWEDGAVLADRAAGIYADPARVHAIRHRGPEHSLDAIHLCEPSPQRVPVLYQAGSSPAGRGFAARHAECVFVSGPTAAVIAPRVAALREAVRAAGRQPEEVLVFCLATVVVAATDAEAHDLLAEYRSYASTEGALALLSGWTGIDYAAVPLDSEVRFIENDAGRSAMENFTRADPDRRLDGARGRRAGGAGRPRPGVRGLRVAGRRPDGGLDGADRRGRLQPRLRGDAGKLRGRGRPPDPGASASRDVQDRLRIRHPAPQAVRPRHQDRPERLIRQPGGHLTRCRPVERTGSREKARGR